MKKTYGNLALVNGKWEMSSIPPHIAIRLKQLFPRIPKWQTGTFTFPYDTNHCADLSWFLMRYPMAMSLDDRTALDGGRKQFEDNQVRMEEILRPDYCPPSRAGLRDGQVIRHYQGQAIELCLAQESLLLGDDIGLGKTYTAAGMLLDPSTLPAAVVVQTHLQGQWMEKVEEFTTLRVHKIKGTKPYDLPDADIYLYKYSQLLGWIDTFEDRFFKAVIYDEIQELRTGMSSGKGGAAKKLSDAGIYRMGLSATPIYNYGAEIWNIMQFIAPDILGTLQDFLREWCIDDRQVRDPDALGAFLREQNVMLRRTKRDVGQQMPPVNTIIEHVDPDSDTLKSVEDLARQLAIRTTVGTFMERGRAGRELDLLMRHTTGVSKALNVARYAKIFLEADVPILLAGWHRDVYDIWLRELAQYKPAMYTGSETERQKDESVRRFIAGETNVFIISLRSGAGLDGLQFHCSTILIGELDWSPEVIKQLIGRVARPGQEEQVTAIYLNTDEGSDPPMVEILGIKSSQSSGIVDPGRQFEAKHSDKSRIRALAERFLTKQMIDTAANQILVTT
jgi:SNF2 family DNA or RNA helicase